MAETFDAWNDGDPGGELPSRYTGPTLIIRGAADPFVSEEMLRSGVLARFPSARRGEIAGVGHMPHVEDPAEVAGLIGQFAVSLAAVPALDGNRSGEVSGQAWTDAFAQQSADAFGNAFADDVVLEAATLRVPVRGKKDVQVTMETASAYYAGLVFTHEAVASPGRTWSGKQKRRAVRSSPASPFSPATPTGSSGMSRFTIARSTPRSNSPPR